MQLIVLASGRGSRLKKLTKKISKCLIKVRNKPIIDYISKNFIKFDKGSGYKNKKPECSSADIKKTIVNNGAGRVNFFTGGLKKDNTPKRKKYLGVLVK